MTEETADRQKTNKEAWEEAAGYGLMPLFFQINGIDPDAPCDPPNVNDQRAEGSEKCLDLEKEQKEPETVKTVKVKK
jgi:hypothetical protein